MPSPNTNAGLLFALILSIAGCHQCDPTPPHAPAGPPVAEASNEAPLAHSVEQDLRWFKRSWEEGLLTKEEYQQTRSRVMRNIPGQARNEFVNPRLTPERIHEELAYFVRMKKEGQLTDAEYESARTAVVNGFVEQGH